MSNYAKPEYPWPRVNLAGRQLANFEVDNTQEYFAVIDNWRASHAHPLNAFYMTLKRRGNKISRQALVVQRIKRLESIAFKLIHSKKMKLTQMQDIGGCRAVMPTVEHVRTLEHDYHSAPLTHTFNGCKDYIAEPKKPGIKEFTSNIALLAQTKNGHTTV